MTQQKLIDILTEAAPKIVETKDPEGVLLKAAAAHNMYPAQLEKLGHAFNSWKTLVAMEKQANRGDSFSLLDVPAMVGKYASYDPHKKLSQKDKELHEKVDNIHKSASDDPYAWMYDVKPMHKAASGELNVFEKPKTLRDIQDLFNMELEAPNQSVSYEIKQASEEEKSVEKHLESHISYLNQAEKVANALKANVRDSIEHEVKKIANYVRKSDGVSWAEIVEDTVDRYGEKCASAIDTIESYLQINHVPYRTVDMSKRAYAPTLLKDRHEQWSVIEKVIDLVDMFKEAADSLQNIEQDRNSSRQQLDELRKQAAPTPKGPANPAPTWMPQQKQSGGSKSGGGISIQKGINPVKGVQDAKGAVNSVLDAIMGSQGDRDKAIDKAKAIGDQQLAIQQLILNDPVLQEADPAAVEDLYNTIASISPTFAKDKNMMSTALKEAVQYGAVPVNMLKDIAAIEKDVVDTKLKQDSLNKVLY